MVLMLVNNKQTLNNQNPTNPNLYKHRKSKSFSNLPDLNHILNIKQKSKSKKLNKSSLLCNILSINQNESDYETYSLER